MLERSEILLIRRYYVYSRLSAPLLIVCFAMPFFWLLLVMINDLVLYSSPKDPHIMVPLYVMLGLVVIYLTLFCVFFLSLRLGIRKARWQSIGRHTVTEEEQSDWNRQSAMMGGMMAAGRLMNRSENETVQKLGDLTQVASAVGAACMVSSQVGRIGEDIEEKARHFKVVLPRVGKYCVLLILLPFLILLGVFLPRFAYSKECHRQTVEQVLTSVGMLRETFEEGGTYEVLGDLEEKDVRDQSSFSVSCHYNATEDRTYVYISVDPDGVVREANFHMEVDESLPPEESLAVFSSRVKEMQERLFRSGVRIDIPGYSAESEVPEELTGEYLSGDGREKCFTSYEWEDTKGSFSYYPADGSSAAYFYYGRDKR